MTWATWLLSMVQPLIVQALIALGVGVLTVTGVNLAVNQAMSWCATAVGGIPSDMLNVMAIGGIFQGMSYIGGAIGARLAITGVNGVIKKFFLQ